MPTNAVAAFASSEVPMPAVGWWLHLCISAVLLHVVCTCNTVDAEMGSCMNQAQAALLREGSRVSRPRLRD